MLALLFIASGIYFLFLVAGTAAIAGEHKGDDMRSYEAKKLCAAAMVMTALSFIVAGYFVR